MPVCCEYTVTCEKHLPAKYGGKVISMRSRRACRFSIRSVARGKLPSLFDLHFILYLAQREESLGAVRATWMWILAGMVFHTSLRHHPTLLWQRLASVHKQGCSHCQRHNREQGSTSAWPRLPQKLYKADNGHRCLNAGSVWLTRGNRLL